MYRTFYFLTCCLLCLTNCTNDAAHTDNQDGAETDTTFSHGDAATSIQSNLAGSPVDLDTVMFSVATSNQQEDPKAGIPSFDIYLLIAGVDDSIFVAREHSATFLEKDRLEDYDVLAPKNALFLINSFHDGAGYYYYGLNNAGKLEIYRIFVKEGKDQPAAKQELVKTVKVFNNRIEAVETEKEERVRGT